MLFVCKYAVIRIERVFEHLRVPLTLITIVQGDGPETYTVIDVGH